MTQFRIYLKSGQLYTCQSRAMWSSVPVWLTLSMSYYLKVGNPRVLTGGYLNWSLSSFPALQNISCALCDEAARDVSVKFRIFEQSKFITALQMNQPMTIEDTSFFLPYPVCSVSDIYEASRHHLSSHSIQQWKTTIVAF